MAHGLRVLVCGGRDYKDWPYGKATLLSLHKRNWITLIIHGASTGADAMAESWARSAGVPCMAFQADWKANGKSAGPIRNRRMLTDGRPDLVVAFPGGHGTADMIKQAETAGVKVIHV